MNLGFSATFEVRSFLNHLKLKTMPLSSSISITGDEICKTIKATIPFAFFQRGVNRIKEDQAMPALLMSAENLSAMPFPLQKEVSSDGSTPTLIVRYMQKVCNQTPGATVEPCGDGVKKKILSQKVNLRYETASEILEFDDNLIRQFCESKDMYTSGAMANEIDALRSRLSREIVDLIRTGTHPDGSGSPYIGGFANGMAGPKDLPLFTSTGTSLQGSINPQGEIIVKQDLRKARIGTTKPFIVGANLLAAYFDMKGISVANTAQGFDIAKQNTLGNFYNEEGIDLSYPDALTHAWVIAPGALQFLHYNNYVGEYKRVTETVIHNTIPDPAIPGLSYDIIMRRKDCEGKHFVWTWQAFINWDLWGYPSDAFGVGCPETNITDVYDYIVTCSDATFCTTINANNPTQPVVDITVTRAGAIVTVATTSTPAATTLRIDLGDRILTGAPAAVISPAVAGLAGTYANFTIDTAVYNLQVDEICVDSIVAGVVSAGDCDNVPAS